MGKAGLCLGLLSWRSTVQEVVKWGVKSPASGFRRGAGAKRLCRFLRGEIRVRCLTHNTGSLKFGVGLWLAGIYKRALHTRD